MRTARMLLVMTVLLGGGCGYETMTATTTLVPLPFISTVAAAGAADAFAYVRDHRTELLADVTIGDGHRLREMAEIVGVHDDHYRAFAHRVRGRRAELVPLLAGATRADAESFVATLEGCARWANAAQWATRDPRR